VKLPELPSSPRDIPAKFMINLELKILRYLNDPVLNNYRKDLFLFNKGVVYLPGKALPEEDLKFEDLLHHYSRKWKRLYTRIYKKHSNLYWYFCRDNHFKTNRNLLSIGDIFWASENQLNDVNLTRDICYFARHFIGNTIHLQNIQPTEELCINLASSLFHEEFDNCEHSQKSETSTEK